MPELHRVASSCNNLCVSTISPARTVRAAVYLRQSRDFTGERDAVARQREACLGIASERGWQVVGEYVDNSLSASDKHKRRPSYERLIEDYRAGAFDALVCWDLDRLTRQPRQLEDWIDAAEERGLRLVTANGEADLSTDGGRLFARIKASVARGEIERKGERQRLAARQRADRGRPPAGVRLTGYTTKGETVEAEAELVREVFARFAAGDSLRSLARWLESTSVPTRNGGAWHPSSVRTMLLNPRYAGRAIYQGEVTGRAGAWEAIVEEDLYDAVQTRLADPRRKLNRMGTDRKYLGSGLYRCGTCGGAVRSWSGARYRCANACHSRSQGPVDEYVLALVRALLARPDVARAMRPEDGERAAQLAAESRRLRARLERVGADYDTGLIDGRRYRAATDRVVAEMAAIDAERARLMIPGTASATLLAADPVAAFEAAPLMIQRAVVDALCTVTLMPGTHGSRTFDPDTVRIEWRQG